MRYGRTLPLRLSIIAVLGAVAVTVPPPAFAESATLVFPEDGATISGSQVDFYVSVPDSGEIQVQIDGPISCDSGWWNVGYYIEAFWTLPGEIGYSQVSCDLVPGTYTWRVRGGSEQDPDEWTDEWAFSFIDAPPPPPPSPPPASSHCDSKEWIFQRGDYTQRGTQNDIRFKERMLASCRGGMVTLSTAHVRLTSTVPGTWSFVEAGWRLEKHLDGSVHRRAFTHWQRNDEDMGGADTLLPASCLNNLEDDRWKVANSFGTSTWKMQVDCLDGVGWRTLNPYDGFVGTGDPDGIVMGETERVGCGATGFAEQQRNLKRRNNSGSWVSWTHNECHWDNTLGWRSRALSATAYITEEGGDSCPPPPPPPASPCG